MKIARIYLRISTDQQDLTRQADIEQSTRAANRPPHRKRSLASSSSCRRLPTDHGHDVTQDHRHNPSPEPR